MLTSSFRKAFLLSFATLLIVGCGNQNQTVVTSETESGKSTEQSQSSETVAEVEEKKALPELRWQDLPFSGVGDRCAVVLKVRELAESETVGHLAGLIPMGEMNLKITPEETEWVASYFTALADTDHSISSDSTMVIKLNRASSVYEIAESRFQATEFEIIESDVTYLRVIGNPELVSDDTSLAFSSEAPMMAVFEYDEKTFVVCEESRLTAVLRNLAPQIQESEDELCTLRDMTGSLEDDAQIILAGDYGDDTFLRDAMKANADSMQENGPLSKLAENANSFVAQLNFDADKLLRITMNADADGSREEIEPAVVDELRKVASTFLAQYNEGPFAASTAFATSMLDSASLTADETKVTVSLSNPGGMKEAIQSLQVALLSLVALSE